MNEFDMITATVFMVMLTIILTVRWKYKYGPQDRLENGPTAANPQLEDEVLRLRDRVQTLERIAVEKEDSLTRQIEQLRER